MIWGFPGSLGPVSKSTAKRTVRGYCRSNSRSIYLSSYICIVNISVSSVQESVGEGMCMLREKRELHQSRNWEVLTGHLVPDHWKQQIFPLGWNLGLGGCSEEGDDAQGQNWLQGLLRNRGKEKTFCSFLQNYCLICKLDSLGTSCGIAGCGFALCNV